MRKVCRFAGSVFAAAETRVAEANSCGVLVVEDDLSIRRLVTTVLQREGYRVEVACDGVEAVLKLGLCDYDVIVLDLMMPGVDGYAVVDRVQQKWPERLPRIIIMTAVSEALRNDFPAPVCAVLPKPFDIDKLASVVHDCARGCEKR